MSAFQKKILAILLLLVIGLQAGTVLAQCLVSSKYVSATAKYQEGANGFKPYARASFSCSSDTSGHNFAASVDLYHNGTFKNKGTGTNTASCSYWPSDGSGTITAVGYAYCTVCGQTCPSISAADSTWDVN